MTALADFIILSHGWRRALLLIGAGAVTALSTPPLFIVPALFVGLPALIWALDGAERRKGLWWRIFGPAFGIGFWFGLGYFAVSLHWLGFAFSVDGGWLLALMPLALVALSGVLAMFWGLGTAAAHLFWSEGVGRALALASCLALAEFARGHLFTGLPFDLLGYALTPNVEMMQATSLVGVYGLTFAAILVGAAPALVWPHTERRLLRRTIPLLATAALLALQYGWGYLRVTSTPIDQRPDMVVRIVQPAVPQDLKWQASAREEIVAGLLALSTAGSSEIGASGLQGITHLVWPEAALPFFLFEEPEYLARIARALPDGLILLTGAPRQPFSLDSSMTGKPYNSVLAIDSNGEMISSYDKTHLVPFGEYLPFQDQLARFGFRQLVAGDDGWAAGEARRIMSLPGTPSILPLICYEAAFSGGLGAVVRDAELIVVLTNDAWFNGSIGLEKLFHHARIRAVEEGLPMIRAANSGISAVINPLGAIEARLGGREIGAIDASPTYPLPPTLFALYGNIPFLVLCMLGIALGTVGHQQEKRGRRKL